jgi:hypothetical protein
LCPNRSEKLRGILHRIGHYQRGTRKKERVPSRLRYSQVVDRERVSTLILHFSVSIF